MRLVAMATCEGAVAWWEHEHQRKPIRNWPSVSGRPVEGPAWGVDSDAAYALAYAALLMAFEGNVQLALSWVPPFVADVVSRAQGQRVVFEKADVLEYVTEKTIEDISGGWGTDEPTRSDDLA